MILNKFTWNYKKIKQLQTTLLIKALSKKMTLICKYLPYIHKCMLLLIVHQYFP